MSVGDWIAGEKPEEKDGETEDTQDRAPILEAPQTIRGLNQRLSTSRGIRRERRLRAR
jgi:hypothetical protein